MIKSYCVRYIENGELKNERRYYVDVKSDVEAKYAFWCLFDVTNTDILNILQVNPKHKIL